MRIFLGLINSRQFLAFKSVKEVPPVGWGYPFSPPAAALVLKPENRPNTNIALCFSKKRFGLSSAYLE
jgi:hypothetical protein